MMWRPRTAEERQDFHFLLASCGFCGGMGCFLGFAWGGGAVAIGAGLTLAALFAFESIRVAERRARQADLAADREINQEFQRMLDAWVERDIESARRQKGELPWKTH